MILTFRLERGQSPASGELGTQKSLSGALIASVLALRRVDGQVPHRRL